jgi:hypothetical protein
MSTVVSSMSEILRVAPWSLRALGYSFGIAERAARFLIWAEAVHGQMLETLRTRETEISRTAALPVGGRTREGRCGWRVDAGGKHLFEAGPPAIDLLTCDVRSRGFGHVALANAAGIGLLAALCDLAARRGIGCVAVYRAEIDDEPPDNVPRSGWLAALPSAGETVFFRGTESEIEVIPSLRQAWVAPPDGGCQARIDADVERLLDGAPAGHIGLSGFPAAGAQIASEALAAAGLQLVDYAERVAAAYRNGVIVDLDDLAHLYELEKRTWAPTSERSRAQAGFGKF